MSPGRTGLKWSGRKDLNLRPPGPEPGALARLRYAPTYTLCRNFRLRAPRTAYHSPRVAFTHQKSGFAPEIAPLSVHDRSRFEGAAPLEFAFPKGAGLDSASEPPLQKE